MNWAGQGRPLNDAFLLQLIELRLRGRQLLTVQFSKLGSDGLLMCDDVVDNVMADYSGELLQQAAVGRPCQARAQLAGWSGGVG